MRREQWPLGNCSAMGKKQSDAPKQGERSIALQVLLDRLERAHGLLPARVLQAVLEELTRCAQEQARVRDVTQAAFPNVPGVGHPWRS